MTIEEAVNQQIAEIMCWFDFESVKQAMERLDWEWFGEGIPCMGRLREHAFQDLQRVGKELCKGRSFYKIACGGFIVEGGVETEEGKKYVWLNLLFGISWNTEPKEVDV